MDGVRLISRGNTTVPFPLTKSIAVSRNGQKKSTLHHQSMLSTALPNMLHGVLHASNGIIIHALCAVGGGLLRCRLTTSSLGAYPLRSGSTSTTGKPFAYRATSGHPPMDVKQGITPRLLRKMRNGSNRKEKE